jgi:hypothetical protein
MNDDADRLQIEQQRIMQQSAAQFHDRDDSGSEAGSSEYEEKTVDETFCEEATMYEEETVM